MTGRVESRFDGLQDPTPTSRARAEYVASLLGSTTRAILHYGSRAQGRVTRPDSAFDFFVIVDNYRDAYRSLAMQLGTPRGVRAVALAWILPPNAAALRHKSADGEHELKCLIISKRHFQRECGPSARDHFVRGRLCQSVVLAWSRDARCAEDASRAMQEIRAGSFDWVRVFLPPEFTVAEYCRTLLDVSLAHEIRPEAKGHSDRLFAAQEKTLQDIYGAVLARLHQVGVLERRGEAYGQKHGPGAIAGLRVRAYFRWSKLRTTLRLLKHPFLYDGWLNYLLRKIDRSTGVSIELTNRERRWPLIFLWPRAWRYLRTRPQHRR
jgi:hypothetical protein